MFKQFAAAALAISISTGALADDFNAAKFLQFSEKGQTNYVSIAVSMATTMVSPTQAKCISAWAKSSETEGYSDLRAIMAKYPDYHPSAVIAAIIEKQCGRFEIAKH